METYFNQYQLKREDAIAEIINTLDAGRYCCINDRKDFTWEVYEQSNQIKGGTCTGLLTVGGMGHASMIAFGIALQKKDKESVLFRWRWAALMHMGGMAFIGKTETTKSSTYLF